MRDKLNELLKAGQKKFFLLDFEAKALADYLISHGVTLADVPDTNVGKWIPVSAPPKENGYFLTAKFSRYTKRYFIDTCSFSTCLEETCGIDFEGIRRAGWYAYDSEYGHYEVDNVAYWSPLPKLPEPPKEGEA